MRVVFQDGRLTAQPLAAMSGPQGLGAALTCP